jgi:hypothetical protein
MSRGYVYVLSNPSMPGLVKIGRSKIGGAKRAKQLYQTGIPAPFVLEFEIMSDECEAAEQRVHESLACFRESNCREFFRLTATEAIIAVIGAIVSDFDHAIEAVDFVKTSVFEDVSYRLQEHPIIVATAVEYISDFAWSDALKKYEAITTERLAEYEKRGYVQ